MQKLKIKSKRDWFIAFIFSFLFIYLIVLRFQPIINECLLPLTPDKISFFNQPDDLGVYAVTVLVMSGLSIGVMIYKKVKGKYLALALAGGIVIAGAIMGSYSYQCHLILKIPAEYRPEAVMVSYYDKRNDTHIDYTLDEETKEQIVDRVLALERISKEEQRDISDFDDSGSEMSIMVWYPLNNGYSYELWVSIKDNVIRIHKGHSLETDPIYQDNGLLEILEKMRNDHQ